MTTPPVAGLSVCVFAALFALPHPARAAVDQSGGAEPLPTAAATSEASSAAIFDAPAQDDDDAALVLAEPDFRIINLPTTMRLPRFKGHFSMTHRFAGNFRRGSFADQAARLFGIDDGAVIGLEYRFGIARHLELAASRTNFNRTLQLLGKWDGVRQGSSSPLSASVVVSVEGQNNFQEQHAPAVAVSVSRRFGEVAAVHVVPTWVNNTASALGTDESTTFIGLGARVRIRPTVYLAAEVSPRVSGFRAGEAQFGFAIEKRAGGHMFQLNATNGSGTTLAQMARGGQPKNLGLGFNLSRKFF